MAASSLADLYSTIKQSIKEFSTQTSTHPKIVMSGNTLNELTDTLKELEYNGAAHYLQEFMQIEGCKVVINNQLGDSTFQLLD